LRPTHAPLAARLHETLLDWRRVTGGGMITVFDAAYPEALRQIAKPPLVLFTLGDPAALRSPVVAVVGSRAAAPGAREWTERTAGDLARCGVLVASGLARGIDAAAHAGALAAGGKTIAVLGCGLDRVYPPEHVRLAARVAAQGCLVSEFPPGTPPRPWHFPLRNRILSGIAAGVVVVQAEPRSGALVTARQALDENRQVMAVPGDVADPRSAGPHDLLRQGAALVAGVPDIFAALGWESGPRGLFAAGSMAGGQSSAGTCTPPGTNPPPATDAAAVLQALLPGADAESLRAGLGWEAARVQRALAELEICGLVERIAGGARRRTRC
jgi:DNA processing protein